ncbi:ephrin-B1-like [Carcharodon carcharias]|uniref:ephrin-B1-like n=1 Tax=Carcharodon carcharias TaxID=13397 RepID=UPI001B7E8918|nr:ephrin-B1-like [Carcharodon carcharias]
MDFKEAEFSYIYNRDHASKYSNGCEALWGSAEVGKDSVAVAVCGSAHFPMGSPADSPSGQGAGDLSVQCPGDPVSQEDRGVRVVTVKVREAETPGFQDAKGYVLYPQIGDRIDLICPQSVPRSTHSTEHYEYYRLYLVTQEQAERCDTVMSPTVLLTCDKPDQITRFTIKFQEFSPNLWGLEFKPQQDYYIITTSEGNEEGLENRLGGACHTKKMKVTLKVGQDPNAPVQPKRPSRKQERPEPSERPGLSPNLRTDKENVTVFLTNSSGNRSREHDPVLPSNIPLIAGSAGGLAFLLIVTGAIVAVVCYRRRQSKQAESQRSALHLSTLTSPKRGTGGNNNGSELSDIIIPLRTSDSTFCPHYEKVSGDYGHPVYIVQEMPPQSPANIYYKV